MSWNYSFPYNTHIKRCYRKQTNLMNAIDALEHGTRVITELHQRCIIWLADNLCREKDYDFSNIDNIAIEYIYFDKEADLLAFRLACGI
jgi:hypothetical protein